MQSKPSTVSANKAVLRSAGSNTRGSLMLSRVISGVILAVSIFSILLVCPAWAFHGVVVIAGLIGAHEYARMARPDSESWERWSFVVICTAVIIWPLILPVWQGYTHGVALSMGFFAMALLRLARPLPIESAMNRLSLDLAGLIYLGATFPFILLLRDRPDGEWFVLLSMIITFMSDTGAYFLAVSLESTDCILYLTQEDDRRCRGRDVRRNRIGLPFRFSGGIARL